jgi:hypothetical protein
MWTPQMRCCGLSKYRFVSKTLNITKTSEQIIRAWPSRLIHIPLEERVLHDGCMNVAEERQIGL